MAHHLSFLFFSFFKRFYSVIFRERGREGEGDGEKHRCVEESLIGCLSHAPIQASGPQPRHVSWLGIKAVTFQFAGRHPTHWTTPVRPGPPPFRKLNFIGTRPCSFVYSLSMVAFMNDQVEGLHKDCIVLTKSCGHLLQKNAFILGFFPFLVLPALCS